MFLGVTHPLSFSLSSMSLCRSSLPQEECLTPGTDASATSPVPSDSNSSPTCTAEHRTSSSCTQPHASLPCTPAGAHERATQRQLSDRIAYNILFGDMWQQQSDSSAQDAPACSHAEVAASPSAANADVSSVTDQGQSNTEQVKQLLKSSFHMHRIYGRQAAQVRGLVRALFLWKRSPLSLGMDIQYPRKASFPLLWKHVFTCILYSVLQRLCFICAELYNITSMVRYCFLLCR